MKNFKLILVLLLISFSPITFAQVMEESELIGTWKVKNVEIDMVVTADKLEKLDMINTAFKESTFQFNATHGFNLSIDFLEMGDKMQDVYWVYNKDTSEIYISENENGIGILMIIKVEKKNGKVIFHLMETTIVLEVVKKVL